MSTVPGKHVVFGRVIRGFDDAVRKIAQVATDEKDRPAVPVIIYNCGELELRKKPASPRSFYFLAWKI
jgi:peptidyl-prolyl isomerase G (cyclophilin G)